MSAPTRTDLSLAVSADLLRALEDLARREGTGLEALVGEALADLLAKHQPAAPRPDVMAIYQASHAEFAPLYRNSAT